MNDMNEEQLAASKCATECLHTYNIGDRTFGYHVDRTCPVGRVDASIQTRFEFKEDGTFLRTRKRSIAELLERREEQEAPTN